VPGEFRVERPPCSTTNPCEPSDVTSLATLSDCMSVDAISVNSIWLEPSIDTELPTQIHCAINFFGKEEIHCSPLQCQFTESCKSGSIHHATKQTEVADVLWGLTVMTLQIALTYRVLLHTADTAASLEQRSDQSARSICKHTISSVRS
jgi:hypothetical protein